MIAGKSAALYWRSCWPSVVQVLLRAGPQGLKVAQILDAACNMGLVKENWAENRASRASQISNAMRSTKLFVHVGDHRYAISRFPGVQLIPLKPAPGTSSLLAFEKGLLCNLLRLQLLCISE